MHLVLRASRSPSAHARFHGDRSEFLLPSVRGGLSPYLIAVAISCISHTATHAGLYHRPVADEILQPVPHWSQFFDTVIPKLRSFAPPDPLSGLPPSPSRQQALQKVASFAQRPEHTLDADDFVDWSGWLIRLLTLENRPTLEEARRVLERGRVRFSRDYRLAAHLATVYQLSGEYDRALAFAQETLDLAPPEIRHWERYHLRLILQRRTQDLERRTGKLSKDEAVLDDLFDYRWWEQALPDKFATWTSVPSPAQPPSDTGAVIQQLLIWFPFDGQLWWLLGEYLASTGQWQYAVAAFQSASDLRLSGKMFRQRRATILEQAQRARQETPTPALPEVPFLDANDETPPVTLWSRFDWPAWTLLLVGSMLLLGLASWQIWIWTRRLLRHFRPG